MAGKDSRRWYGIYHYITVASNIFHTEKRLEEFKEFFEPKVDQPGLGREIRMDTKNIESKVDVINAEKDAVNQAVRENL